MSSRAVLLGSRLGLTGLYLRRKRLFRSVTRPAPSTLTLYWSCGRASTTMPVLSHLVGCGPVWFWILTCEPTVSGGRAFVCSVQRS